jgi:hypothetical protein
MPQFRIWLPYGDTAIIRAADEKTAQVKAKKFNGTFFPPSWVPRVKRLSK